VVASLLGGIRAVRASVALAIHRIQRSQVVLNRRGRVTDCYNNRPIAADFALRPPPNIAGRDSPLASEPQVMRPGFRQRRIKNELLGHMPSDWRTIVQIVSPVASGLREVLSLGDRYVISFGAHGHHQHLLMDRSGSSPLTIETSLSCCALLGYAVDGPVVPLHYADSPHDVSNVRDFDLSFRSTPFHSANKYFEALSLVAEAASELYEGRKAAWKAVSVQRILTRRMPTKGKWPYYPWPKSDALWRAVHAYALGSLSVPTPSRVLNFWRSVEAVTTHKSRVALFETLPSHNVAPVWATAWGPQPKTVNVARGLKGNAVARYRHLVKNHGSASKALDAIYWEGRGKAAHADKRSLEFDSGFLVAAQLHDAELLRFFARVAIERAWA